MLQWWIDWKSLGALPFGGTDVLSQPNHVVEVIRRCEQTIAEIAQEGETKAKADHEKMMREAAKNNRRGSR